MADGRSARGLKGRSRPSTDRAEMAELKSEQSESLGLQSTSLVTDIRRAAEFLAHVGVALRYGPSSSLPLASLYRAFAGHVKDKAHLTHGIALTNRLLGEGAAIEVHVVADRVCLVHSSVAPSLYALVRRGRGVRDLGGLSVSARTALGHIASLGQASAGDVRERLGIKKADPRNDPAYAALAELTRFMLVDRGPFEIPKAGIPYLSTEGYPYHLLHEAHRDVVAAARKLSIPAAADRFLSAYLRGAVFAYVKKMATLFRLFLSAEEIDASLRRLVTRDEVRLLLEGSKEVAVSN